MLERALPQSDQNQPEEVTHSVFDGDESALWPAAQHSDKIFEYRWDFMMCFFFVLTHMSATD